MSECVCVCVCACAYQFGQCGTKSVQRHVKKIKNVKVYFYYIPISILLRHRP